MHPVLRVYNTTQGLLAPKYVSSVPLHDEEEKLFAWWTFTPDKKMLLGTTFY